MGQRVIEVLEYDPRWTMEFESEKNGLQSVIGDTALKIEHIGSTSVPGLAAKPVIDILIEVSSLELLDLKCQALEVIGYKARGEYGIPGRRYFQKGGDKRTHHVHVFLRGDQHLTRHRAFKDYLKAYPAIAQEYALIKRESATNCQHDSALYQSLKNGFIQQHERVAMAEFGGDQSLLIQGA